jgi:hypothetical protein
MIAQAGSSQDEQLRIWAANAQALVINPEIFNYADWCEGDLVRKPRRLLA